MNRKEDAGLELRESKLRFLELEMDMYKVMELNRRVKEALACFTR